jgi:hypothetical protein
MSQVLSYRGYAAECSKLAREEYSADGRRILLKMAADWLTLADMAAKREGEAERIKSPPEPEPACEPVVAQRDRKRAVRRARVPHPDSKSASSERIQPDRHMRVRKRIDSVG